MNVESPTQLLVNPPLDYKCVVTPKTLRDPSKLMKACVWFGPKDMRIVEVPKPLITDPRDIILKITCTTVCGSDLHIYENKVPGDAVVERGDILGHEFMGLIESVGPAVKNLKVGDRVVVSAVIACGECKWCLQQKFSLCDKTNPSSQVEKLYGHRLAGIFGYTHLTGGYDGGQAEFVRVPIADVNCLKVPDSLTDEQVLFLSDIACTSYHGAELGQVSSGDTVAIWGCGPVGLLTAQWCYVKGAKRVICIDNDSFRLGVAKQLGAETLDFSLVNVPEWLLANCPEGPDVCIECVGFRFPKSITQRTETALGLETDATDIINEMVKACQKGGRIALIGDYFAYGNHFPVGILMEKGLTITGSQVYVQKYWRTVLSKIEAKVFDPTVVITHHTALDSAPEVYKMFGEHKALKVIIKPAIGATAP